MALVPGLDILAAARAGRYGVGAFNTNNMEITQAILEAAEETRSPVIVALSEGGLKYGETDDNVEHGKALARCSRFRSENHIERI